MENSNLLNGFQKQLVCIQYPGTVNDELKAFETLGGLSGISQVRLYLVQIGPHTSREIFVINVNKISRRTVRIIDFNFVFDLKIRIAKLPTVIRIPVRVYC